MKAISIKIPDPLFHDLALRARASSISQSEIIRAALAQYLQQGEASKAGSCAQRASRWAGILEGPADLSTHPEHLAGFGQ